MCQKSTCQVVLKPVAAVAKQLIAPASCAKSSFRLSPFRKVAKSARINLNRYWGILSQSAAMKSTETCDFSVEMEQNRINEMLEAQSASSAAISDNEWNSEYENSPDFQRRSRCQSVNSWATSSVMSSSRSSTFGSDYCYDTISQDSVFL